MTNFQPGMSADQKAIALGKGNVGATAVCLRLNQLDPFYLELLDALDITGPSIYILFNDVCGKDLSNTGLVLVACYAQVSGLNYDQLMHAINNRGAGIDVNAIVQELERIGNINQVVREALSKRR